MQWRSGVSRLGVEIAEIGGGTAFECLLEVAQGASITYELTSKL